MKSSLNILLICKTMPWQFKGGIQTHTWELAKALSQANHKVSVLTGGPFRSTEIKTQKEGVEIISLPYFPGRYIKPISFAAEEISFNVSVRKWVKSNHNDYDIIHAQGRSGYLLFGLKGISKKLLNTVHGLVELENSHLKWHDMNNLTHRFFAKRFESKLLNTSKINISVSESLKGQMKAHRSKKALIEVIPNGVSTHFEKSATQLNGLSRFLFVGRLHPVKGVTAIIEHLHFAPANICIDIIGDGSERTKIESIIKLNGLENRVRLLGEHSNDKVHEVLPYYRALILPSQYETQGIVLLEANAHAIPVIASDIPAIRETIENHYNGLLCDPNQPMEFIKAMEYMTEKPEIAREMGEKGMERVRSSYGWNSIAERTIDTYYKLAQ
ncbi:MAG: glycosyltransferase involved in cell wall biosynthesis [Roseivirga sp.]|jgi:glycosyltransferase involved in cell wall biosynthesis